MLNLVKIACYLLLLVSYFLIIVCIFISPFVIYGFYSAVFEGAKSGDIIFFEAVVTDKFSAIIQFIT